MSQIISISRAGPQGQSDLTDFKLSHLRIRKATLDDVEGVVRVAASVGNDQKDPETGFLMHDYSSSKTAHVYGLKRRFHLIDYFFVAEALGETVGFLQAYSKQSWLEENPFWLSEVYWKPGHGHLKTTDFALIDKTAVLAPLTGCGIGSKLYEALFQALEKDGIHSVMAETVVGPVPNLASMRFRLKQRYELVGIRYERLGDQTLTDLVYHRRI